MHYHYQGQFIRYTPQYAKRKQKSSSNYDQLPFFHLPTELAENDPFLRGLYSFVIFALDDHPYPSTSAEFYRRTFEIRKNVRDLNLEPSQGRFLKRLMEETGVSLVNFF
jgi:hypothetical protein